MRGAKLHGARPAGAILGFGDDPAWVSVVSMETDRNFRGIARHVVAALLLLLIAVHAMAPAAGPLERTTGSAFSSTTVDVSLLGGRMVEGIKRVVGLAPVPPIAIVPPVYWPVQLAPVAQRPFAWPEAIGPPWHSTAASPLAPRAPPAA